jgi:class 3 adenylate cyclase/tetratricopeptide (TPR) repeat protein
MSDLQQWLESLGLGRYVDVFAKNDIDSEALADLTEQDLATLGVSLGHRKKLFRAISEYCSSPPQSPVPARDPGQPGQYATIKPERRHLTVLFCDLVGSTALSAQLDPEDLREILHEFQSYCSDAIQRYEGHIARFSGDGVLAYFGFPKAHEDEAERAVKAALQMLESISAFSTRVGQRIEARVGIATGLVVVGDLIGHGSAREFMLVGEAPNLAARLQALAGANQILVAPRTRRLLGDLFELADLGENSIKGFDHQVHVWRVVRPGLIATRFEARQSAHMTPLVGRDIEVSLLHEQYLRAATGHGWVTVISGEPGIGKSRLIMALRERLSVHTYRLTSLQCSSYHTSSSLYPFIHLLERAAAIVPETGPSIKLDRLEELVEQLMGKNDEIVSLLAALLSIPTGARYPPLELAPQQQKNRTFAAILSLLEAQTKQQPVLLVFEDVHWIDPTSLELLERIRAQVASWRMLAVILVRPEFELSWADQPHTTTLAINRLDREEVVSMVESLAIETLLPRNIIKQIVTKADGVPLFTEEITKAVLEAADRRTIEAARLLDFATMLTVPDTLHESLMARLDLAAPMKRVAQVAAVIGREFSLGLLKAVAGLSERDVHVAVDQLLESGILFRSGETNQFTFKHALVQDEAYASLLRDERGTFHAKAAEALCGNLTNMGKAVPEIIAHHYTQAGQIKPAIDYWMKAGRRASERFAFAEAGIHLQMAVKLLLELPASSKRDELELRLQHALGNVLIAVKGFGAAETSRAFERALELCHKFEGWPQATTVISGMIGVHLMREEFEHAQTLARGLLQSTGRPDDAQRLMGHRALGTSLFYVGELTGACEHLTAAIELYDAVPQGPLATVFSQDQKATAQVYLALVSLLRGDVNGGLALGHDAVAYAEHLRHPHSLAYVLAFLAGAYVLCNKPDAARPIAERGIALSDEHGFPLWRAGCAMMHGWTEVQLGDAQRGLAEIRDSMDALEVTGALTWVQFARYLLAQALMKTGQLRDAVQLVDQTLAALGGSTERWYEAEFHRLRGDLLLGCNEPPGLAEASYERAITVAERQGSRLWQLRAVNALAALWHTQGKDLRAHSRLTPLCAGFDEGVVSTDLERAKALLEATG